jgi:hypothetical protein
MTVVKGSSRVQYQKASRASAVFGTMGMSFNNDDDFLLSQILFHEHKQRAHHCSLMPVLLLISRY